MRSGLRPIPFPNGFVCHSTSPRGKVFFLSFSFFFRFLPSIFFYFSLIIVVLSLPYFPSVISLSLYVYFFLRVFFLSLPIYLPFLSSLPIFPSLPFLFTYSFYFLLVPSILSLSISLSVLSFHLYILLLHFPVFVLSLYLRLPFFSLLFSSFFLLFS